MPSSRGIGTSTVSTFAATIFIEGDGELVTFLALELCKGANMLKRRSYTQTFFMDATAVTRLMLVCKLNPPKTPNKP